MPAARSLDSSECSTSYSAQHYRRTSRGERMRTCAAANDDDFKPAGAARRGRGKARAPPPPPPPPPQQGAEDEEEYEESLGASLEDPAQGQLQRLLSRSGPGESVAADVGPAIKRPPTHPLDMYETLYGDQDSDWRDLPLGLLPRSADEERKLMAKLQVEAYFMRQWNHEDVDDLAFFEAEKMRGKANNIYANVRRVASMMNVIEAEDFAMAERQSYFTPWARAEIAFASEYDDFNAAVKANIDSLVRQPLEEELRERLEAIGEATLLPPTEAEQQAPKFPSDADVSAYMMENFLEGVLPGVSLTNPNQRYADDIYGGDEEGADELLNMVEEQEGDGEAEPADE
ncbi:hypothetical protein CHLRE_05g234050v5 [Chlamydomonas reinhardtii]|uniref:Uncharacterized protein n=1 Tax=Chlamydomonas reinhardtii TaxID=3055 RepID=A0A2K3DRS4_CHLRE|nr:uncharacterized protein CHLRE_05g234050v5 [Chlamydomonas reinhardtii]PNW83239.1 hypothetical protein CHLRE_05g234050v5 [Chlamydomonas reinhardtii]